MPTPTTIEVNGFALREIRVRSGQGVAQLAQSAEVSRAYIAKLELGHSHRVSPKVFNALLAALSITDRRALIADPHAHDVEPAA